jgi:TPR repeat protein
LKRPWDAFDRVARRFGVATMGERLKLLDAWEFSQVNDRTIWDREAEQGRLREAHAVRERDPPAAFALLLDLAEQGSVWSMMQVALGYHAALGVPRDMARAEEWYRRASEGGSQRALLEYIRLLWRRSDAARGEATLGGSAGDDWAPALYWRARFRLLRSKTPRRTLKEVRPLLERATELGSPAARRLLAAEMSLGRFGIREIPKGMRMVWKNSRAEHAAWKAGAWPVSEPEEAPG